jgi:large conductance mechanosensitive channel
MFKGFRDFLFRGNVIDLAVAVVIGAAFNNIVNALVKDLITPLIAALGGQPDFSRLSFTINKSRFMVGDFINALVSFLIVSSVVYFLIVIPMNKIMRTLKKDEPENQKDKTCPECLSKIPLAARKCRYCSSRLSAS